MIGRYTHDDIADDEDYGDDLNDEQQVQPPPKPQPTELRATITAKDTKDTGAGERFESLSDPAAAAGGFESLPGEPAPERHLPSTEDYKPTTPDWSVLGRKLLGGFIDQINPVPILRQLYAETEKAGAGGLKQLETAAQAPLGATTAANIVGGTTRMMAAPATALGATVWQAGKGTLAAAKEQYEKADKAFSEGRYSEALGHFMAGNLPVLGPAAADVGEAIGSGEPEKVAEGVGGALGMIAPMGAVEVGTKAAKAAAPFVKRLADVKAVHAIAPQLGKDRWMYVAKAMEPEVRAAVESAPEFAGVKNIDTAMQMSTERLKTANKALQAAYDAIPPGTTYSTAPVIKRIDDAIRKLTPGGVESETVADRLKALKQARKEVVDLGPTASPGDLRQLRINWDVGAEKEFTPSIQQGSAESRQAGKGWADARGALQSYLSEQLPHTRDLNATYSLWKNITDVLSATVQTETGRATVGRHMVGSIAGTEIAGHLLGAPGWLSGWLIGPFVNAIHETGYTGKIATTRGLARLAELLEKGGSQSQIMSTVRGLAATTGTMKELNAAIQAGKEKEQQ